MATSRILADTLETDNIVQTDEQVAQVAVLWAPIAMLASVMHAAGPFSDGTRSLSRATKPRNQRHFEGIEGKEKQCAFYVIT